MHAHLPPALSGFVDDPDRETPYVVVDLAVVEDRYRELHDALPGVELFYAVKANPAPEIIVALDAIGASFDVASMGEVELCLSVGVDPARLSFGNTIKKRAAVAAAYALGVRNFAVDCPDELHKVMELAPGSTVLCRVLCAGDGAAWPLSEKFGCAPAQAVDLLRVAKRGGHPIGVSFHVGSQQTRPDAWRTPLGEVLEVAEKLAADDIELDLVNLGGGFPGSYDDDAPGVEVYGRAILDAVAEVFGDRVPALAAEPGRYLVADAGVIVSEVVLVARKDPHDPLRWVYLDVGVFSGLVETVGESVRYPIRTRRDGEPTGPAVLAGPTCDSLDVMAETEPYELPLSLADGDRVLLLTAGAYTTTYSSVAFNGFPPLVQYVVR